jgi:hypothetical protein
MYFNKHINPDNRNDQTTITSVLSRVISDYSVRHLIFSQNESLQLYPYPIQ